MKVQMLWDWLAGALLWEQIEVQNTGAENEGAVAEPKGGAAWGRVSQRNRRGRHGQRDQGRGRGQQ